MIYQCDISNLKNGKYGIDSNNFLLFNGDFEAKVIETETDKKNITIDKISALEIMHTLLDSTYMLNNQTEKLLEQIEEKINHN